MESCIICTGGYGDTMSRRERSKPLSFEAYPIIEPIAATAGHPGVHVDQFGELTLNGGTLYASKDDAWGEEHADVLGEMMISMLYTVSDGADSLGSAGENLAAGA